MAKRGDRESLKIVNWVSSRVKIILMAIKMTASSVVKTEAVKGKLPY